MVNEPQEFNAENFDEMVAQTVDLTNGQKKDQLSRLLTSTIIEPSDVAAHFRPSTAAFFTAAVIPMFYTNLVKKLPAEAKKKLTETRELILSNFPGIAENAKFWDAMATVNGFKETQEAEAKGNPGGTSPLTQIERFDIASLIVGEIGEFIPVVKLTIHEEGGAVLIDNIFDWRTLLRLSATLMEVVANDLDRGVALRSKALLNERISPMMQKYGLGLTEAVEALKAKIAQLASSEK